jgi:hypothetical protein
MAHIDKIEGPPDEHHDQPVSTPSGDSLWINYPAEEGGWADEEDDETETVVGGW